MRHTEGCDTGSDRYLSRHLGRTATRRTPPAADGRCPRHHRHPGLGCDHRARSLREQAKVGPRFFYESFDDLDALAAAVHDEIIETAIRSSLDALAAAPDDIAAKTRAAVTAILESVVDDPRRARIAFAEAHGSEILMRRRAAAMRTIADVVAEQERALLDPPAGSETLVSAVSLMITGGAAELVLAWLDGGMDISRDELINLCVEFVLTFADNLTTMAARLAH